LLESNEGIPELTAALADWQQIAVDTEADSLHCYFEKLCLIQIGVPGHAFLLDPLSQLDLSPLWAMWEGKELIFHGADYDLRLLRRAGFAGPKRIFDTMIAARLVGITDFSYGALVLRYFGEVIPKSSQRANWALRPLPHTMLEYAVKDTYYLHQIADELNRQLHALGRRDWFDQSCERAIRATLATKEKDTSEAWKIQGSGLLRDRASAILRELWNWREREAQTSDRPTFHILANEALIRAAQQFDRGEVAEFRHLRGSRLQRFEEAVERALAMPPEEWPKFIRERRVRPSKEEMDRFNALKQRRDKLGASLNLDPSLIAAKAHLEAIAFGHDGAADRLMPWQRGLLEL
jgi:ribonuclease D